MKRAAMLAGGVAVLAGTCAGDMPAVDIYKVRWAPLQEAAAVFGADAAEFSTEVEKSARREGGAAEAGVLVLRPAVYFTDPMNRMVRNALQSGRAGAVDAFFRAVKAGGWITGQLVAREGGDYVVSLGWREEAGERLVVEYEHAFKSGRRVRFNHILTGRVAVAEGRAPAWIREAREIVIEDHWTGLSPVSPIEFDYTLRRDGTGGFAGRAVFAAAGHFKAKRRTDSLGVTVPAEAAAKFLGVLADCAVRDGAYKPSIRHTDDYPSIRITLRAEGKIAVFHSESQGEGHAPWAFEEGERTAVVEGCGPGDALKAIDGHLAPERRKALVDSVTAKSRGQATYE